MQWNTVVSLTDKVLHVMTTSVSQSGQKNKHNFCVKENCQYKEHDIIVMRERNQATRFENSRSNKKISIFQKDLRRAQRKEITNVYGAKTASSIYKDKNIIKNVLCLIY